MSLTFHNMRRRRAAALKAAEIEAAKQEPVEEVKEPVEEVKEPVEEVKEPVEEKKPSVRKTGAKNDSKSR